MSKSFEVPSTMDLGRAIAEAARLSLRALVVVCVKKPNVYRMFHNHKTREILSENLFTFVPKDDPAWRACEKP